MEFLSNRAVKGGRWRGQRRSSHLPQGWRRERALRPNLSRRWLSSLKAVFIIGVLLVFYFLFSRLRLLEVKRVVCQDENKVPLAAPYWCPFLQAEFLDRNFFFLDIIGAKKRFKNRYPEFSELYLQRDFPLVVKAGVQKREALAFVIRPNMLGPEATPSAETLLAAGAYLVDEEGRLFTHASFVPADLPYLYYTESGELEQTPQLSGAFWQFSLKMLGGLKRLGLAINAVRQIDKGWLEMDAKGGPVIYLSPAEKLDKTLAVLQLLVEKYRIEGKRLKKIDLRFREPVVDY